MEIDIDGRKVGEDCRDANDCLLRWMSEQARRMIE